MNNWNGSAPSRKGEIIFGPEKNGDRIQRSWCGNCISLILNYLWFYRFANSQTRLIPWFRGRRNSWHCASHTLIKLCVLGYKTTQQKTYILQFQPAFRGRGMKRVYLGFTGDLEQISFEFFQELVWRSWSTKIWLGSSKLMHAEGKRDEKNLKFRMMIYNPYI